MQNTHLFNINNATLFTSFESMLFEFNQEEDLDKSHQTILQLLRIATLRRYKLFTPTNLSHVICDKCGMCFSDINWIKSTKKHAKRCDEAQKIKLAILTIWKNQEKSPELSSAQNKKEQDPTISVIQTHNENQ